MSESDLNDSDPNFNEINWANQSPGNESEHPDVSESDDSGESEDGKDEVQSTHDPQEVIQPDPMIQISRPQPKTKTIVIRKQTRPEPVDFPRIVANSENWRDQLARRSKDFPEKFFVGSENDLGRPAKRRQDDSDNLMCRKTALNKKFKVGSLHKDKRANPSLAVEPQRDAPNFGRLAPPDGRDNLDEEIGPVQRGVTMWEGIVGNLKALGESTALLATKAQQLTTYMPTMMSWIDETFESNSRHSQRMRDSRLPKTNKDTPQGETLAADTLGTLVSVSGPRGGEAVQPRAEDYGRTDPTSDSTGVRVE